MSRNDGRRGAGERASALPRVSFIVPVFNDAVRLQICLRSIAALWCGSGAFEVLVVDNGSSDGSADLARRSGATVVVIGNAKVAELRNRAAKLATGEVLAFVDADNEIAPGWLVSAIDSLRLPNVAAVGSAYQAPIDGTWVQRAYGCLRGQARGRHDVEWLTSGNLAVWRSAFERAGGFDTSLDTCEDVALCQSLRAAGFRVVSDERLRSIHHGDPATLWELFKGELWRGRDNLRVSFRPPIGWRTIASALVPMAHVGLLAASVVALAAAGTSLVVPIVLAGGAASLPAWLRVARALRAHSPRSVAAIAQTFAVACVYDVGRALALVMRTPHRNRRSATA